IVPDEGMFITFGGFHNPNVIIAFFGIITAAFFLVRKNQYAVFLGMIGAALCGLFIRFGASMDWFNLSQEVVATLPQLPQGSPVVLPVEPMNAMMNETFMVAVKNLDKMLSLDSIIVILTFLFLDFFGT
ncbi:NCS2 family permease, partial [Escherichia coli]